MKTKVFDDLLSKKGNDGWKKIKQKGFQWPGLEDDDVLRAAMIHVLDRGFSFNGKRITNKSIKMVDNNKLMLEDADANDFAAFLEEVKKTDAFTKMHPTSKFAGKAHAGAFNEMIEKVRNLREQTESEETSKSKKALKSIDNDDKVNKKLVDDIKKASRNFRTGVNKLIDSTNAELDRLNKKVGSTASENPEFIDAIGNMVESRKARIEEISNKLNEKHLNEEKADKKVDSVLAKLSGLGKKIVSKFRRNSSDDGE